MPVKSLPSAKSGSAKTRRDPPRASMVAALVFILAAISGASAQGETSANHPSLRDKALQDRIGEVVEKQRKAYGGQTPAPGVLIGVWDGAGEAYIQAFGLADLAQKRPMAPEDHFRIGSNTKTFIVSVLLQLVDEGKIGLNDPLSHFPLDVTVPDAAHITIRQLCEMRSGLFEVYDSPEIVIPDIKPDQKFDLRQLIELAVKQKPYFPPGKGYHYSNTNYLLLGLIIENLTHETVGEQIRKRLLEPFHLKQTFYPETQAMPTPSAHGYGLGKQGEWEDVGDMLPVSLTGAAGAMISDMADMRRWVNLYVKGATNGVETQRARLICLPTGEGNLSFGLGIGCSAGWYGYTGGLPGYNTSAYYFPEGDITVVALVNIQAEKPPPGVSNAIFREIAQILTPGNTPFVFGQVGGEGAPSTESPPGDAKKFER